MRNPKVYRAVQDQVGLAAQRAGRDVRDYSADVWTGIRETVHKNHELFGTRYKGSAIHGESKGYADHFNDLLADKAAHLRITPREMEKRLRAGDANLLSVMLSTPAIAGLLAAQQPGEPASRPGPASLPAPDL